MLWKCCERSLCPKITLNFVIRFLKSCCGGATFPPDLTDRSPLPLSGHHPPLVPAHTFPDLHCLHHQSLVAVVFYVNDPGLVRPLTVSMRDFCLPQNEGHGKVGAFETVTT